MIFYILQITLSVKIVGIDLGSQYIKAAENSLGSEPHLVQFGSSNQVPAAVAFSIPRDLVQPFKEEQFKDIRVLFGNKAIRQLRKNASSGVEFLPKIIGRSETEFLTTNITSQYEMSLLFFLNLVKKFDTNTRFAISVPNFWTHEQRRVLNTFIEFCRIPLISIVDDMSAVSVLYANTRTTRFTEKKMRILFIDVGGTSVKSYGTLFRWAGNISYINHSSFSFNEDIGGYFFAKKIAECKGVSIKKGYKLLQNLKKEEIEKCLGKEINELKDVIAKAKNDAFNAYEVDNLTKEFDEIQLIGGASRYDFVLDAIKSVVGDAIIKRDFNANEAIAIGAVHAAAVMLGVSIYPPCQVIKRSFNNITFKCGSEHLYCKENGIRCNYKIIENTTCDKVYFISDKKNIPKGVSNILSTYNLNIKNKQENGSLKFRMIEPLPIIGSSMYCVNNNCSLLDVTPDIKKPENIEHVSRFINLYLKEKRERKKLSRVRKQIFGLIDKIDLFLSKSNEQVSSDDNMMKIKFENIQNLYEKGELNKMSFDKLKETLELLQQIDEKLSPKN